ncbi:MAG: hypothetical protein A2464_09550 [Deltaproteobacteria bacterium RIFOXYC2_FULL_48_10]|nr:MAG: hypothetical protein A2464_09550 [Deltaproteobacteria bacterium RIFOXYC2_FULL_48_10]
MYTNNVQSLCDSLADGNFKNLVCQTAHSLQVSTDMALIYYLSGISSAVNGKIEVAVKDGWKEQLSNFFLIIGDSGEKKSPIVKIVKAPHKNWVLKKNEELKTILQKANRDNKRIKAKIRVLTRKAEAAGELEYDKIVGEIEALENQIQAYKEIRLFFGDITLPALIRTLDKCNGRICHFEPEGGLIDLLCQKQFDISIFCNGYDGEDIQLDRVKEEPIHIKKPFISLSLTAQPKIGIKLLRNSRLKESGFLGRCLYAHCPSRAGYRQSFTPQIPKECLQWWNDKVTALLDIPDQFDEFGNITPWRVEFDYGATIRFNKYREDAEFALRQGGRLSFCNSYGSKQAGKVLRLAGLLHCIIHDDPKSLPIDEETMWQAINLGEGFIGHAQELYFLANHGTKIEAGQRILDWLHDHSYKYGENKVFNVKDAYDNTEGFTRKVVQNGINFLVQQGVLTECLFSYANEAGKRTVGRKKGPYYTLRQILNPVMLTDFSNDPLR